MEPHIEIPQELIDRAAAVRIGDAQIQHHYREALKEGVTDEQFVELLTHDIEALERNAREIAEEQAKERELHGARERQANRIALAGMALPAAISEAADAASIKDIAGTALAFADELLAQADATKDPILND